MASKVAARSTVKSSDTVAGQTQAPKSRNSKSGLHPKVQTDVSAAPASPPGPWKREKMGVVTVYEPAGGAFDKNSEAFQLSGSTAVM